MEYREEHDSMGRVPVLADRLWGAQTERSRLHFPFGERETMPREIIHAFGLLKGAAACANAELCPDRMTPEKYTLLAEACAAVAAGEYDDHFPLSVFQTGSGTQTNMNANEVIARLANRQAGRVLFHPNDDVNMSQSSNDTFPTAMHIAAVCAIENDLLPALDALVAVCRRLEEENRGVMKCGRTHLQDAVPLSFAQEISGWRTSLERDGTFLRQALEPLREIALGATAVGTGLNAPRGFGPAAAAALSELAGTSFRATQNGFHALTSKDELVFAHGACRALAADLMKMANDIRFLSSGPRCGLGEITIPENEPGSSIMPGKVNPTQCESIIMVAVQVMADDTAVGMAAAQGNFELNVCMPVLADAFLRSVRLLTVGMTAFREHCVAGIRPNREKMHDNLHRSLMLATALTPHIGYENAAKTVQYAAKNDLTLREACVALGFLTEEVFDRVFRPEDMANEEDTHEHP